jgi:hypothetical protein
LIVIGAQGDQIERIFASWVIVFFGKFFFNFRNSPKFLNYFFNSKSYVLYLTKMGWDTFWATFSQTHLVTLSGLQAFYMGEIFSGSKSGKLTVFLNIGMFIFLVKKVSIKWIKAPKCM